MSRIVLAVRDPAQALERRHVLAAAGHDVVALTDAARTAQTLLMQHQPHLVVTDLRLADGTALAMIQWLARQPQRPLIVAAAHDESEPLLLSALRDGADNLCVPSASGPALSRCVEQTLQGETVLGPSLARALLDHFERSGAPARNRLAPAAGEQSALELESAQRDLLMRMAVGYRVEQLAQAQALPPRVIGQRLRAIVRKLQWDVRAGSLTLQWG